jgi:hypothetical protein
MHFFLTSKSIPIIADINTLLPSVTIKTFPIERKLMQELYRRLGPQKAITGDEITVICFGRARNTVHASMYLVNSETWGIESRKYSSVPHICNDGSTRGCVVASHLIALSAAYKVKAPDTKLNVVTRNQDTARLIRAWQVGDTPPPAWYHPEDTDHSWLTGLAAAIAMNPDKIHVTVVPLERIKGGTQAWATLLRFEDQSYTVNDAGRERSINKIVVPELTSWRAS